MKEQAGTGRNKTEHEGTRRNMQTTCRNIKDDAETCENMQASQPN